MVCSWYFVSDLGGLHKSAEQQVAIPSKYKGGVLGNLHGCRSSNAFADRLLRSYGTLEDCEEGKKRVRDDKTQSLPSLTQSRAPPAASSASEGVLFKRTIEISISVNFSLK